MAADRIAVMDRTVGRALLLWDVDHTLIENGGVSKENYALAFELLTGRPAEVQPGTDGRTDIAIMGNLLAANGVEPGAFSWDRQAEALTEAGERNRERLAELGHAMPGAMECLSRLAADPSVVQSVLTGNIVANARVKLGAFGLDQWLDFEVGGFGADDRERAMLVPAAQRRAAGKYGFDPARDVTVLVGDTPLDVQAGLVGGARVIAVATGLFGVNELAEAGADVVLAGLADTNASVRALERVREMGPTLPQAQAK